MEKDNCNPEWGILVHQLRTEFMGSAMRILPKDIKSKFFDNSGMRVYFSRKERADDLIRQKNIKVGGILCNIYSLVTCLTVYGINNFASREEIETYFRDNGLPTVLESHQMSNTDDYRVVLDISEVLANFDPPMILLSSNPECKFLTDFYCRVCRAEGHKQYQCLSRESQLSITSSHDADNLGRKMSGPNVQTRFSATKNLRRGSHATALPATGRNQEPGEVRKRNADLPETGSEPSTSNTLTSAESVMATHNRMPTKSDKGPRNAPQRKYVRSTKRGRKEGFPCRAIVIIIPKISGVLKYSDMLEFLEEVHKKKNAVLCAKKFTSNIPDLIDQIKRIIVHYKKHGSQSSTANKDIKILEQLCARLNK